MLPGRPWFARALLTLTCCTFQLSVPLALRAAPALDCGEWVEITGTQPPPRGFGVMAFDTKRERALVFGGRGSTELNDVWELSMATLEWSEILPSGNPPSKRIRSGMIYDPIGDRLLVFAGVSNGTSLNDVWSLSLSGTPTWTQLSPAGAAPPARGDMVFVYDPARQRAVMFGGVEDSNSKLNDTWVLSMTGTPTWTQISTANVPSEREGSIAAFDPPHDRLVIFSGDVLHGPTPIDTWALDFSGTPNWTQLSPAGVTPEGRYQTPGVYDPVRQRILFSDGYRGSPMGGVSGCYALSLKNEPAWITLDDQPVYRYLNSATFDPARGAYIVFSGVSNAVLDDTWMYGSDDYVLDAAAQPATQGSVIRTPSAVCYSAGQVVQLEANALPGYVFTGWSGDATGTTNPLSVTLDANQQIIAHFDVVQTVTLLERFDASASADGIALHWRFAEPARIAHVALERAASAAGPWVAVPVAGHEEFGETVAMDRDVEPNQEYFYELEVVLTDGSRTNFGPVSSQSERILESAITRLAPNPTSGATSIQFAVAKEGRVRIDVLDVAGRLVAKPLDAVRKPGRYTMGWEGRGAGGRLAPGLYWARLVTPDRTMTRTLALTR